MSRERTRSTSGEHRLLYVYDLDHITFQRGLWNEEAEEVDPELEQVEALREAIKSALTPRQRQVLELYFFEGASQGDIAARLLISQQVVHKCLYGDLREGRRVGGALARLREALSACGSV